MRLVIFIFDQAEVRRFIVRQAEKGMWMRGRRIWIDLYLLGEGKEGREVGGKDSYDFWIKGRIF